MANDLEKPTSNPKGTEGLLHSLRELIQSARQKVLRAVDTVQVQTCWEIGRHIVEFEQGGVARAEYGTPLLPILAEYLSREFGRGFDATNLRHMRVFYQAFPIRDALRPELSWTHYRTLLKVEQVAAWSWYMPEAAAQGWTTRALERQINTQDDTNSPIFSDLKGLLEKTARLVPILREEMEAFGERIQLAFIYGSTARSEESSESDVDLMIVGDVGLSDLVPSLRRAERRFGRPVNPTVYSSKEFKTRARNHDHFLTTVLRGANEFVKGNDGELAAVAGYLCHHARSRGDS